MPAGNRKSAPRRQRRASASRTLPAGPSRTGDAGPGPVSDAVPARAVRVERDTMGEMEVPADVLYGASTQRAVLNFPVSGQRVPDSLIRAYALVKAACAVVNHRLGRLDESRMRLIVEACNEIRDGLCTHGGLARHFPVDVFQTGSGTSTNMNVNEVIANLVCLRLHRPIGSSRDPEFLRNGGVHPNDHANLGQSSNDTFPTAMNVAAALGIRNELLPAIERLAETLDRLAARWDHVVKIGRTHLQDATPIRLGQEFSGYASQMRHATERLHRALHVLGELAIGGTAVGTGINTHERFGALVAAELSRQTGLHFREAQNHFEAQHARDAFVELSGHLRTIAVSLSKIANDIRLLGSGPRCGLGELILPAVQPGSSIMPGKVNPVICESVIMVCCRVVGHDATVAAAGLGGVGSILDLNVAMPVMAAAALDSIHLLARAASILVDRLLTDLQPDEQRCLSLVEFSLAMCTSLVPAIGYDRAAAIAKEAYATGQTVRQVAHQRLVGTTDAAGRTITADVLDRWLDPLAMTRPGGEGSAGG